MRINLQQGIHVGGNVMLYRQCYIDMFDKSVAARCSKELRLATHRCFIVIFLLQHCPTSLYNQHNTFHCIELVFDVCTFLSSCVDVFFLLDVASDRGMIVLREINVNSQQISTQRRVRAFCHSRADKIILNEILSHERIIEISPFIIRDNEIMPHRYRKLKFSRIRCTEPRC